MQIINPKINKYNSSIFLNLWLFLFFIVYIDFLGFGLHINIISIIIIISCIFFIFRTLDFFYEHDSSLYGWDSLKNLLINLKILFFEIITVISRPLRLTLRLSINLIVGHVAGFIIYYFFGEISSLFFFIIETFIIFLQITVFRILVSLYFNE
jgi:F0F1-type ATP synthase membrane subunit a